MTQNARRPQVAYAAAISAPSMDVRAPRDGCQPARKSTVAHTTPNPCGRVRRAATDSAVKIAVSPKWLPALSDRCQESNREGTAALPARRWCCCWMGSIRWLATPCSRC